MKERVRPCTGCNEKQESNKSTAACTRWLNLCIDAHETNERQGLVLCGEVGAGRGHEALCPATVWGRAYIQRRKRYVRYSPYGAVPGPLAAPPCLLRRAGGRAQGRPGPCPGCRLGWRRGQPSGGQGRALVAPSATICIAGGLGVMCPAPDNNRHATRVRSNNSAALEGARRNTSPQQLPRRRSAQHQWAAGKVPACM